VSEHAFRYLQKLGAGGFAHVSGSLALHLRGTEALLRRWGNREAVCLAGLYHAVYGTAGIRGSLASLAMRGTIAHVIGAEAEALAYLYGACERDAFHRRIGTARGLLFADRFTASEYPITESQLRDFCELTLANELELALASERFRLGHRAELSELVDRMERLVSDAALLACKRAALTVTKEEARAGGLPRASADR
jgi:hypothetical protein